MLSGAKHPHLFGFKETLEILRFAQDDSRHKACPYIPVT